LSGKKYLEEDIESKKDVFQSENDSFSQRGEKEEQSIEKLNVIEKGKVDQIERDTGEA
jgi:hypothetical protein